MANSLTIVDDSATIRRIVMRVVRIRHKVRRAWEKPGLPKLFGSVLWPKPGNSQCHREYFQFTDSPQKTIS
jgi:hypothetical protein